MAFGIEVQVETGVMVVVFRAIVMMIGEATERARSP